MKDVAQQALEFRDLDDNTILNLVKILQVRSALADTFSLHEDKQLIIDSINSCNHDIRLLLGI